MIPCYAFVSELNHWPAMADLPGLCQVVVDCAQLTRFGALTPEQTHTILNEARSRQLATVLNVDIVPRQREVEPLLRRIRALVTHHVTAFSVRDPGVARLLSREFPQPLHLELDVGHRNQAAFIPWLNSGLPISQITLSPDLPLPQIRHITQTMTLPCAYWLLGLVPLLHARRRWARRESTAAAYPGTARAPRQSDPAFGSSHASPWRHPRLNTLHMRGRSRTFPVLEDAQGTILFWDRILNRLDILHELEPAGIERVRIDLRFLPMPVLQPLIGYLTHRDRENLNRVTSLLPLRSSRGYAHTNQTDRQFSKLCHRKSAPETAESMGTVLEVRSGSYMVLQTQRPLGPGTPLAFHLPEGHTVYSFVQWMEAPGGHPITTSEADPGIWVINHVPGVSPGTRVQPAPAYQNRVPPPSPRARPTSPRE